MKFESKFNSIRNRPGRIGMILLLAVPFYGFTQQTSLFDRFEDTEDVKSIVITKSAFRLMGQIGANVNDPEAREYLELVDALDDLRVLETDNADVGGQMKKDVDSYLKKNKLAELMRVKDGDKLVRFNVRYGKDENHVSELLMFVTERGNMTLLALRGNIDLNKIAKLAEKMNVSGIEDLKKINKVQNK